MTGRGRSYRLLKGAGISVAIALTVLVLALTWVTTSASGRGFLLEKALQQVNGAIPGRVEVRELARLELLTIRLQLGGVRVVDPSGQEAAFIDELDIQLKLQELLFGRIHVPSVRLAKGSVDLRQLGDSSQGLVAAFVDPDAPPDPPSSAPPPYILVSTIEVREFAVRAPVAGSVGQLDIEDIDLNASYELDTLSAANLESLTATLRRSGEQLGSLHLSAALERGTTPSTASVKLQLTDATTLEADATVVVPPEANWRQLPVSANVHLKKLSATKLADLLGDSTLKEAFLGQASLRVRAAGTPERLQVDLQLESAGGQVDLSAEVEDFERVTATVTCNEFQLQQVRADLPARRLSLQVETQVDLTDPARIPLTAKLHQSSIDATALPTLSLATTITPGEAHALTLRAVDGPSHLQLSGDLGFSGAVDTKLSLLIRADTLRKWNTFSGSGIDADGQIEAELDLKLDRQQRFELSGDLQLHRLKLQDLQVQEATASFQASGTPGRPQGKVRLELRSARIAGEKIRRVSLEAEGDLHQYQIGLKAAAATASGALYLKLKRGHRQVSLEGHGEGLFRAHPWSLRLSPTTVGFDGQLQTDGIDLKIAKQGFSARGRFSPSGGALMFESKALDLARLAKILGLAQPLRGQLQLAGQLSGTPQLPRLELTAQGTGLQLGERPALAVDLRSLFDAGQGLWTAKSSLRSGGAKLGQRALDLTIDLSHKFRGGPESLAAVLDGNLDAHLSLKHLDLETIGAWAEQAELPATGVVRGEVHASGTRLDPKLRADLDGEVTLLGAALTPELHFEYAAGAGKLQLGVKDLRGPWLDLQSALGLSDEVLSVKQLMQRVPTLASDAEWSLKLAAQERELKELPGLSQRELFLRAGAQLQISHAPGAEPSAKLQLALRPTKDFSQSVRTRCQRSSGQLQLDAALASGKLVVNLKALERGRSLLNSHFELPVAVAPALKGRQFTLGALSGDFRTESLDLQTLPLLCSSAQGKLSASGEFEDLLGPRPRASVEARARDFSMGSRQALDMRVKGVLDERSARADVVFTSGQKESRLSARLPLKLSNGSSTLDRKAPIKVDLDLRRLPIAPFLNPRGAISYASGDLDGKVRAQGSLDAPRVHGRVSLKDLALTATALAQPLRRVSGILTFTEDRLVFRDLQAHDKDGAISLDGDLNFKDSRQLRLDLAVQAKQFPIRQQGQVVATADLEAEVKAIVRPDETDVRVKLGAVDMWIESLETRSGIALAQHADFVIDGQAAETEGQSPSDPPTAVAQVSPQAKKGSARSRAPVSSPKRATTKITLSATDRVWVKRDDFAVKVSAELITHVEPDAARVEGRMQFVRGYLMLLGKEFSVQRGSHMEFIGSAVPDPVIDITARHDNRRSGETVSVEISGRSSAPKLEFKVDDQAVAVGQAFQAIYGSEQSNQDPAGASGQARAFVGGLVAGLLATTARRELGAAAPIVMIEPGESGVDRVRAGFEFDSLVPEFLRGIVTGVYVEGIVGKEANERGGTRDSAQTQAGVLLELYFPRNLFSAGQYGPGPTWSVDLGWQL